MVNNNNDDNIRILYLSFHTLNFTCLRKQNLQEKSRASVNQLANLMVQRVSRLITMSIRIFTFQRLKLIYEHHLWRWRCGMSKLHGNNIFIFKFLRFSKTRILKFKSQLTFVFFSTALILGNRSSLQWVQKVVAYDLWLVDVDPVCVFLRFKVRFLAL